MVCRGCAREARWLTDWYAPVFIKLFGAGGGRIFGCMFERQFALGMAWILLFQASHTDHRSHIEVPMPEMPAIETTSIAASGAYTVAVVPDPSITSGSTTVSMLQAPHATTRSTPKASAPHANPERAVRTRQFGCKMDKAQCSARGVRKARQYRGRQ